MTPKRDHGGGLDAAVAEYGGTRADWIDLSTGINPVPYPVPQITPEAWTALPDSAAQEALVAAARAFWNVPNDAAVSAAPGASALIARIPALAPPGQVQIATRTYNEHAAAFDAMGWTQGDTPQARVVVHPNNPDGALWDGNRAPLTVVDESFCDVMPDQSQIARATEPGLLILKSFGKFWGLAGLRLGFVIGDPGLIDRLAQMLGPWPVSGPALDIATRALRDPDWADATRRRLTQDAARLDALFAPHSACVGGTDLFRLYDTDDAAAWQARLAHHHIWTRIFPYSKTWLRVGLPHPDHWARLEAAL